MNIVDNRIEIWPGSPRNFATEPATWYDWCVKSAEIGTHNYRKKMVVNVPDIDGIIWGNSAWQSVFYAARAGQSILLCMQPGTANYSRIAVPNVPAGEHEIVWERVGISATYLFDGVEVFKANAVACDTQWETRAIPRSTTGIIISDAFHDLTTEKKVWYYPSESERLRLTTTNGNVYSNPLGYFEAANPAIAARIDSQIDLRGKVSDYTVVVDFDAANFGGLNSQKQELAGQGPAIASNGTMPICSLAYGGNPGGILQLSQEIGRLRVPMVRSIPILSGRHVAAATVEVNHVSNNTTMSVYLDGVRVLTPGVYAGIPTGISTWPNFAINDNRSGAMTNQFGKIYAAALFNRALSAAEIAYLSK